MRACSAHSVRVRPVDACTPNRNLCAVPRASHPRRAEAERVTLGGVELFDLLPLDLLDRVGSPAARCGRRVRRRIGPARIGVHQQHLELAAIERIDQARRVEAGDAVTSTRARSGAARTRRSPTGSPPRARWARAPAHRPRRARPPPGRGGRTRRRRCAAGFGSGSPGSSRWTRISTGVSRRSRRRARPAARR